MDKHDIEYVKTAHNIVDVIGRYVALKKNGKNYSGLCPFHSEKTPSFTVSESKQFYHCFGCGSSGDVIKFVQEYSGVDFVEAYKELGGEVDLKPAKEIIKNQQAAAKMQDSKLPPDHREDGELANKYISKCILQNVGGVDFHRYKTGFMLPIYNSDFELINAAHFGHGKEMEFIAGGLSYTGFTPVRVNDDNKWAACVSLADGRYISHRYNINVAVTWSCYALNYVCKWFSGELKITPALRDIDDDWIAHEMRWVRLDNYKLEKMERK